MSRETADELVEQEHCFDQWATRQPCARCGLPRDVVEGRPCGGPGHYTLRVGAGHAETRYAPEILFGQGELPALLEDGAPLVPRGMSASEWPPVCGRCGVEYVFYTLVQCGRFVTPAHGRMETVRLFRPHPACRCWRVET